MSGTDRIAELEKELQRLKDERNPFFGHEMFDRISVGDHKLWNACRLGLKKRGPSLVEIKELVSHFPPHEMRKINVDCFVGYIAPEQADDFAKGRTISSLVTTSPFVLQASEFSIELKWFTKFKGELYECNVKLPENGKMRYQRKRNLEVGTGYVVSWDDIVVSEQLHKIFGSTGKVRKQPTGSLGGEYGRHFYIYWENAESQQTDLNSFLELYFAK